MSRGARQWVQVPPVPPAKLPSTPDEIGEGGEFSLSGLRLCSHSAHKRSRRSPAQRGCNFRVSLGHNETSVNIAVASTKWPVTRCWTHTGDRPSITTWSGVGLNVEGRS